jgi:hypothetical protein
VQAARGAGADGTRRGRALTRVERHEDGEVAAFLEIVERGLAIADGGQLAAQEIRRRAVDFGLLAGVDHSDMGAGPQRRAQVPQQAIGLLNLVVHVDEESEVDRPGRKPRVVRVAADDGDRAGEALARDPARQAIEIFWNDVLGNDVPPWSDPSGQAHRVIAAASADIGDGKTGPDAEQAHHPLGFTGLIARFLVPPDVGDNARDRPRGRRKRAGGHARRRQPVRIVRRQQAKWQ